MRSIEMEDKIKRFKELKGAKFVWVDKDNIVHYMEKEQFDKVISTTDKVVTRIMVGTVMTIMFSHMGGVTYAAVVAGEAVKASKDGNQVMEWLKPLIDLIIDLAEPVSYGYMVKGFLKFVQGKEEEAKKTLTHAAGGYVGVKFIPQLFAILDKVNIAG